jgi:hypothetical protein
VDPTTEKEEVMGGPNSFIEALEQAFVTPQPAPEKARCAYCGDSDRPLMKESPHGEKICEACHQSVHPSQAQPDAVPALPELELPPLDVTEGDRLLSLTAYQGNAYQRRGEYLVCRERQLLSTLAQLQLANERAGRLLVAMNMKREGEPIIHALIDHRNRETARAEAAEARLAQPELKAEGFKEWWKSTGELIAAVVGWEDFARRCWHDALHTKSGLGEDEERKAFEEWFEADAMPLEHSNWFRRDEDGEYEIYSVAHAWDGWKARAGLRSLRESKDSDSGKENQ